MFNRQGARIIESDEEFAVERLGKTGIRYYEHDHIMEVQAEIAKDGVDLWRRSLCTWLPPYEVETIDDAKRDAIITNIRRALESEGDQLFVIG